MALARCLRTLAIAACLVMAVSFVLFGIDQASGASQKAQVEVNASGAQAVGPAVHRSAGGGARNTLDDVDRALATPFSALAPGTEQSWGTRVIELLGGLVLYGFGLGALARSAGLARLPAHDGPGKAYADARFQ